MLRKIALFIAVFGLVRCQDSDRCGPGGWSEFDGGCYLHIRDPKSWRSARKFCQSYGSDLTSISSQEENDFVADLANEEEAWIGMSDTWPQAGTIMEIGGEPLKLTATWAWSDGTPYGYTNWAPEQPSGVQDCIQINYDGKGLWDDQDFWTKLNFVCEKPVRVQDFRRGARRGNRGNRI
ncbi:snaclec agglucetin subunit beta-2-like [Amphiura filiformis]|uniref:snaclec agglucetin subunit beta-2-like n=1 Tax=Amphiura filiformis TaxID=82378 RepID=UPI003B210878